MKKTALTIHEKAVQRVQRQSDKALDTFRKTETDLMEANSDLLGVVTAIDIEMDKLSALRIKTQKQLQANEVALKNISALLGKGN